MASYLRHGGFLLFFGPLIFVTVLAGGAWTWLGFIVPMAVVLVGDAVLPPDTSTPVLRWPGLLNLFLFGQLLLTVIALILVGWKMAPGDFARIGEMTQALTGWDVLRRRDELVVWSALGVVHSISLLLSGNFFVAHELIHRRDRLSAGAGKLLLAAVGDTQFAITHLHQHHKHVGTRADPATARRGESVYRFMFRSAWGQWVGAWRIEKGRLARRGRTPWSLGNRFIAGQAMTLSIVVLMGAAFRWQALLVFLLCAARAKALNEAVNYVQHYGLVRVPGTPVGPRHSWDCAAAVSGSLLINLPRHADHHARANVPFWKLRSEPAAPPLSLGYFAAPLLAMVPSLWRRRMKPLLRNWDRQMASDAERALLREHPGRAGDRESPRP